MIPIDDTIVAIATPIGEGGLGVVRLSGPDALKIADTFFTSPIPLITAQPHTLHTGSVTSNKNHSSPSDGSFIDQAVAAVFHAPRSYTGENVIELSCHGNPSLLNEVVQLAIKAGARLAEPGEFTKRAYLNGKMDLAQAEAVADLIHAQSSKARLAATQQLKGLLSTEIKTIRQQAVDLLAHIEANLDFVEEDIPNISKQKISESLSNLQSKLETLIQTSAQGQLLRNGIRVVLAGQPNVGKSSLFNALLSSDRAIVTDVPGTTRDTLEEKLDWFGMPITLVDTAGLRETTDQIEQLGTQRATEAQRMADVVLLVLDGSQAIGEKDNLMLAKINCDKILVVLNKSDIKSGNANVLNGWPSVQTSAKTGYGLQELREGVLELVQGKNRMESANTLIVTNQRHIQHLNAAYIHFGHSINALAEKRSEESIAMDLRQAVQELSHITGESVGDDVLSAIFRQFCVGK